MEFDKDLTERFNNLKNEKKELNKKMQIIGMKEYNLYNFINRCAIFDESIIFSISDLLSYKERERFMPIIYKKIRQCGCYPPRYSEDTFIGIAPDRNITEFIMSKSENIDRFLGLGLGYEIYQRSVGEVTEYKYDDARWIIKDYNLCDYEKNDKRTISFGFLLNNFELKHSMPTSFSHYDFIDYPYVQDFIIYLFNLQVQRHGKRLTCEEMHKALNDFLVLEETKTKTKKK